MSLYRLSSSEDDLKGSLYEIILKTNCICNPNRIIDMCFIDKLPQDFHILSEQNYS